jgi:hypothetical protein
MALTSGSLETCLRVLGTGETLCTSRPTRLFFMLEAHGPHGTAGHVAAWSPPRWEVGSGATRYVVLWSLHSESGASGHMAAPEPTLAGRRVLEPLDMWQPRRPPQLGGWIQCYKTCGGAWLHAPLFVLT